MMPQVRHPCEDARLGRPPSRESPRDESLHSPRLKSLLRATALGSYIRRYRTAFGRVTPRATLPRIDRQDGSTTTSTSRAT